MRLYAGLLVAGALLLTACGEQAQEASVTVGFYTVDAGEDATVVTNGELSGQVVRGTITVFVASEGWMRTVRFDLDDVVLATLASAPYEVEIDTTQLAEGAHVLRVEPHMPNGNVRGATTTEFIVDNEPDPTDPTQPDPTDPDPTDPDPDPTQPPVSPEIEPRLLAGYWQIVRNNKGGLEQQVYTMRYNPWQFETGADLFADDSSTRFVVSDPGEYRGWDYLSTRHHLHANVNYPASDFVFLRLERDATVAIVWYGSPTSLPSWLAGWMRGGDVVVNGASRATFTRVLPAGDHYLGTTEGRRIQMYTVLLAEADGAPSPLPHVPSGWGERVAPNTVIPRDHILHNVHFADGPDGRSYPTWHAQIDPAYWAYFEHDHGSDPRLFAGFPEVQPVWSYTDPSIGSDYFFGFKVFVADLTADDGTVYSMMMTAHLDNLTRRRLCERFHTLDIAIADKVSGKVLVRTHMLADLGFPRDEGLNTRVNPAECPEVMDIGKSDTSGRRNVNVTEPGAYESWQYDLSHARALPWIGGIAIMQQIPLTVIGSEKDSAGNYTAERLIYAETSGMGTGRHFQFAGSSFGIDARSGTSGHFCTDRYARKVVDCGAADTVAQFIEPGFHFSVTPADDLPRYGVDDPWTALYTPKTLADREAGVSISVFRNLEHAVRPSN